MMNFLNKKFENLGINILAIACGCLTAILIIINAESIWNFLFNHPVDWSSFSNN